MPARIRIISGSLRGRKISCTVHQGLRPTPERVRQALFNILDPVIIDRPFFDVFAGTGVIGLEARSRGASNVVFVERDFRLVQTLSKNLRSLDLVDTTEVVRADVYRWAKSWALPQEPINLFLSPPFGDLHDRQDKFPALLLQLQQNIAAESTLVVQAEVGTIGDRLTDADDWQKRTYGRNQLLLWSAGSTSAAVEQPEC